MTINPVGGALPALPTLPTQAEPGAAAGATGATASEPGGFKDLVVGALDNLSATQGAADELAQKAMTGDLQDVHDYMIAATQAGLATELTVAVRNRAVEAFNSIMSMQV
jgi:flagellar hook-basal body complex protein FliE